MQVGLLSSYVPFDYPWVSCERPSQADIGDLVMFRSTPNTEQSSSHKGVTAGPASPALAGPIICQFNRIHDRCGAKTFLLAVMHASCELLLSFVKPSLSAVGVVRRQVFDELSDVITFSSCTAAKSSYLDLAPGINLRRFSRYEDVRNCTSCKLLL